MGLIFQYIMNFARLLAALLVVQAFIISGLLLIETNVLSLDPGLKGGLEITAGVIFLVIDLILVLVIGSESEIGLEGVYLMLFFYSQSTMLALILVGFLILTILNIVLLLLSPVTVSEGFFDYISSFFIQKEREDRADHRHIERKLEQAVEDVKERVEELKQVPQDEEKIRIVSINGKNFHRIRCLALTKVAKEDRKVFDEEKLAIEAGYKPCKICLPTEK
jgi:hypothetical protein